jgi:hypothetical protein
MSEGGDRTTRRSVRISAPCHAQLPCVALMWRCPHCGAPQAESARCWVCHRSSTTCSTCRHFQTALSADLGWCALDPKRLPLTGLEQRGCWQERPGATAQQTAGVDAPGGRHTGAADPGDTDQRWATPSIDFVPVELVGRHATEADASTGGASAPAGAAAEADQAGLTFAAKADEGWTKRTSLFGDPEP